MALQNQNNSPLANWNTSIVPAISTLRQIAGTTEDEFLQIGAQLQSFYQRSADISGMANQLVSVVSGENVVSLTSRLQKIMSAIDDYLANARSRSNDSRRTLERVLVLLDNLSDQLEGFQKMNKSLRMFNISTKIESARLGVLGSGFVDLALDVEKLSYQVHEKSAAILAHRQRLVTMIAGNLTNVHSTETEHDAKVTSILRDTADNLQALVAVNERCTRFGYTVSMISGEVIGSISEVVSSMQMHDMTRQQLEHIIEALKLLSGELSDASAPEKENDNLRRVIVEAGDVCELQEASLRYATSELYSAVCTIIDNLREVARKQAMIAHESISISGSSDTTGTSFLDVMSRGMLTVTSELTSCAWADQNLTDTMKRVAQTIDEIAAFVTDIEAIGSEIELIALNSQIKAALTGSEGAALGVLAEAIKRLSDEAVHQIDAVAETLSGIHTVTEHLLADAENEENQLGARVSTIQEELEGILRSMGVMNTEMRAVLSGLNDRVLSLTEDVERVTVGVDVHERIKTMSGCVLSVLDQIVFQSRQIEPANNEFKEHLRHLEERYTMESERHIHGALARKRSGLKAESVQTATRISTQDDAKLGDNFDLF